MSDLTEYTLGEKVYIDLKQVFPLRPYAAGCHSIPQLINRKGYRVVINGRIIDGVLHQTERQSHKFGSKFVCKDEVKELFDTTAKVVDPPAPPILEDKDLVFFRDENGIEYKVLMRGERTREGIFFKVKDVMKVCEIERLDERIARINCSSYIVKEHYMWFTVTSKTPPNVGNTRSRELYLTYNGLMRVLEVSRTGVGYKFKEWINDVVFAAAFGTAEQKASICAKILNIDAEHLKAVMSKASSSIKCLYLIDTKDVINDRKIYKYGYTKNLKSRFFDHMRTYGKDIELIQWTPIPQAALSVAEKQFKDIALAYVYERDGHVELIALNDKELKSVKDAFELISDKCCGELSGIVRQYEHQLTNLSQKHELAISELKRECNDKVANMRIDLVTAQKDNELYQLKIQMLEMKLAMLQQEPTPIDEKYYELLRILPDSFFIDSEFMYKMIYAFRNSYQPIAIQKNTVRKLLMERTDGFDEEQFNRCFDSHMNDRQSRYRLAGIEKMIKQNYGQMYDMWARKWNGATTEIKEEYNPSVRDYDPSIFVYAEGSCVCFSSIKRMYRNITMKKLVEINPQFTSRRRTLCASCKNFHKVGCCNEYSISNRTSAVYIDNIQIRET